MAQAKTLYVSDMDGTLLGGDSRLSGRSTSLLNEAIDSGALFTVATARTPATVSSLLKDVHIDIPAVVMTGAVLWNPRSGEYTHRNPIRSDTAEELAHIYSRLKLPTFIYKLRDVIEIYHLGPLDEQERMFMNERCGNPYKRFATAAQCDADGMPLDFEDIVLFYAMRPNGMVMPVYEEIRRNPDIYPVCYHDMFGPDRAILEVFSSSTSKANATRELAGELGATRIVAFGDNLNDLPLLRAADVAVAVGNAVPQVKEAADIIIGSNLEDAVPQFILNDMGIRN